MSLHHRLTYLKPHLQTHNLARFTQAHHWSTGKDPHLPHADPSGVLDPELQRILLGDVPRIGDIQAVEKPLEVACKDKTSSQHWSWKQFLNSHGLLLFLDSKTTVASLEDNRSNLSNCCDQLFDGFSEIAAHRFSPVAGSTPYLATYRSLIFFDVR